MTQTTKNTEAATPTVLEASTKQTFSETERLEILKAFETRPSDQSAANFAKKSGISTATLSTWRKKYNANGKSTKKAQNVSTALPVGYSNATSEQVNKVIELNMRLTTENTALKAQLAQFQAAYGRIALQLESQRNQSV